MEYLGFAVGCALLMLACDERRRGLAVRVASGLSWLVLLVGLAVHSVFASADWAWSAWNGLLVGGVVGVVLSVLGWLVKGAGAASGVAGQVLPANGARWLVAGVVVMVFGGVGWWFFSPAGENESASLVADGAGPSCLCSQGAQCTGPRGGVYCLTDAGKKKYSGHR